MALLQWIFTSILQIRPDSSLSLSLVSLSSSPLLSTIQISSSPLFISLTKQSRILLFSVCLSPCGSTTTLLSLSGL